MAPMAKCFFGCGVQIMNGDVGEGTPVLVLRQLTFSSTVISESRLSIRFFIGSEGSLNGERGCWARIGVSAGTNPETRKQSKVAKCCF